MILNSKDTTISYRCPVCGKNILSIVGIFSLSGDMIKLKCDCGESELTIVYTKDRKIRISVPCVICPKPHNFLINGDTFFGEGIFALPCPLSDLNICFIGSKEEVLEAVEESDRELSRLMAEAGIENFDALREHDKENCCCHDHDDCDCDDDEINYIDPYVDDVMRFLLEDLKEAGDISCKCEEASDAVYGYEFREKGVRVYCETCGGECLLPIVNASTAEQAMNCDKLELK
ncbi:MAG: hypothetical protein E7623_04110 [Ruminococcaceae bacterium]|nr:hypothetical protein [Oscillospiraceae bacterium]